MTREEIRDCSTCKYEHNDGHMQPCRDCGTLLESYTNWEQKEKEQQPCEDAVSRQAVCNIVDDIRDCISVEGYWAILERLKKLPSVTQKSGKWKYVPDADGFYICSECGCGNDYADNFCPQCGAKMESEDKNEL